MKLGDSKMKTIEAPKTELDWLVAPGRSPEIPESLDVYGWLVGSWELDVRHYWVDVSARGLKGEAHFAWVLDGCAVQDVWGLPLRSEQTGEPDGARQSRGTTLRVWDAALQAWRVTWINPVTGVRCDLIGRWNGKDIVQIGTMPNGTPIRWKFTEITADSFRWTGESLQPDGKTWKLEGDFRARRFPSQ
jgi:hypothetical protein